MIQGKEVPTSAAEGFLRGVDQDPKFQRFHERLDCLAQVRAVTAQRDAERAKLRGERDAELTKLRAERREISVPPTRSLALGLLLALPLVALAAALPWWPARVAELAFVLVALVADEVKHRRLSSERAKRYVEVSDELERVERESAEAIEHVEREAKAVVKQLEARVADIDAAMSSSIKVIDPDTFGPQVKKEEEKRSS